MFLLAALAVPFLTSCDDDEFNTKECTVGFTNSQMTVSEFTDGYVNIPIAIDGRRNGPIHITVSTEGTGSTPAVEGENYAITDKTLNVNPDTLSTGTVNVELRLIDDYIMNADRQFTLTITSVDGATVETNQITVTITDNDGNFYDAFAGQWYFNATNLDGAQIKRPLTITAAQQSDADYENVLYATASNLCGYSETLTWQFQWVYDDAAGMGVLAFLPSQTTSIGSYGGVYSLHWQASPNGSSISNTPIEAYWDISETGIPQTITFDNTYMLLCCASNGQGLALMQGFMNITLTRE